MKLAGRRGEQAVGTSGTRVQRAGRRRSGKRAQSQSRDAAGCGNASSSSTRSASSGHASSDRSLATRRSKSTTFRTSGQNGDCQNNSVTPTSSQTPAARQLAALSGRRRRPFLATFRYVQNRSSGRHAVAAESPALADEADAWHVGQARTPTLLWRAGGATADANCCGKSVPSAWDDGDGRLGGQRDVETIDTNGHLLTDSDDPIWSRSGGTAH